MPSPRPFCGLVPSISRGLPAPSTCCCRVSRYPDPAPRQPKCPDALIEPKCHDALTQPPSSKVLPAHPVAPPWPSPQPVLNPRPACLRLQHVSGSLLRPFWALSHPAGTPALASSFHVPVVDRAVLLWSEDPTAEMTQPHSRGILVTRLADPACAWGKRGVAPACRLQSTKLWPATALLRASRSSLLPSAMAPLGCSLCPSLSLSRLPPPRRSAVCLAPSCRRATRVAFSDNPPRSPPPAPAHGSAPSPSDSRLSASFMPAHSAAPPRPPPVRPPPRRPLSHKFTFHAQPHCEVLRSPPLRLSFLPPYACPCPACHCPHLGLPSVLTVSAPFCLLFFSRLWLPSGKLATTPSLLTFLRTLATCSSTPTSL